MCIGQKDKKFWKSSITNLRERNGEVLYTDSKLSLWKPQQKNKGVDLINICMYSKDKVRNLLSEGSLYTEFAILQTKYQP